MELPTGKLPSHSWLNERTLLWTLRFTSPDVEAAFLQGRCEMMHLSLSRCTMILAAIMAVALGQLMISALIPIPGFPQDEGSAVFLYSILFVLFSGLTVLLRMPCVIERLGFFASEIMVVVISQILLGSIMFWGTQAITADDSDTNRAYRVWPAGS